MSNTNISTFCDAFSANTATAFEAREPETGRCFGVFDGNTADVFSDCCPWNALTILSRNGTGAQQATNYTAEPFYCTYLQCTVNSSAEYDTLEKCVKDAWDSGPNSTRYENQTVPFCRFDEAGRSAAMRERVSWVGMGVLVMGVVGVVMGV